MKIFRDAGVAYLDSVENFEQICADFIHGISFKFFLDRKGALCSEGGNPPCVWTSNMVQDGGEISLKFGHQIVTCFSSSKSGHRWQYHLGLYYFRAEHLKIEKEKDLGLYKRETM